MSPSPARPSGLPSGARAAAVLPCRTGGRSRRAGNIGIWCWDIPTNRLTWSSNLEDIHDLPKGSFDGSFSLFENDIHPQDRAGVVAAIGERQQPPHRTLCPPPQPTGERWLEIRARGQGLASRSAWSHLRDDRESAAASRTANARASGRYWRARRRLTKTICRSSSTTPSR
jgi:hypothetical protein